MARKGSWALRCGRGRLEAIVPSYKASEARFRTNFAKAERVLEETALCAQDWLDIALVLRRSLASGMAQNVLRFVAKCPIHGGGARPFAA